MHSQNSGIKSFRSVFSLSRHCGATERSMWRDHYYVRDLHLHECDHENHNNHHHGHQRNNGDNNDFKTNVEFERTTLA